MHTLDTHFDQTQKTAQLIAVFANAVRGRDDRFELDRTFERAYSAGGVGSHPHHLASYSSRMDAIRQHRNVDPGIRNVFRAPDRGGCYAGCWLLAAGSKRSVAREARQRQDQSEESHALPYIALRDSRYQVRVCQDMPQRDEVGNAQSHITLHAALLDDVVDDRMSGAASNHRHVLRLLEILQRQ